ncbi:MAG: zinc/manganese transport system substrate-binding protein [Myxococcota bacterium]|jgi:zinc/manganese transport system substrate-binding protein
MRALFLLLLTLPLPAFAGIKVVTTVPDLAAITAAIGGEHVDITPLSLPTQDPHFVDARPSLALALSRADLLVAVGLDLEIGWLPVLQQGARNARIQVGSRGYLDCSQFVMRLEVPGADLSRAQGDVHPGGNPHYLVDPRAALAVASGIATRLVELDPKHAADYTAGLTAFQSDLLAAQVGWSEKLAGLSERPMVAYHRSWPYLADWAGFSITAYIEPKPGIPPSPSHLVSVLASIEREGVSTIIQESYYPSGTAQQVADRSGTRLVVLPGGSDFAGGQSYIAHIDEIVTLLTSEAP